MIRTGPFRALPFADLRAAVAAVPEPEPLPQPAPNVPSLAPTLARTGLEDEKGQVGYGAGLCMPNRANIYPRHDLGLDWKCRRCGLVVKPPAFR